MKDPLFIQQITAKAVEAGEKVKREFSSLSPEQLNWKPSAESWSIAQCLDHLVISDSLYFPEMKEIVTGDHTMRGWKKWNPFSGLFGKVLIRKTQENPVDKLKAPKVFIPSQSTIDPDILDRFHTHQDELLEYISTLGQADLDKTKITSPVSKWITYSLRHAITIIVQHEHRHINQATRLKAMTGFPADSLTS